MFAVILKGSFHCSEEWLICVSSLNHLFSPYSSRDVSFKNTGTQAQGDSIFSRYLTNKSSFIFKLPTVIQIQVCIKCI